MESRLTERAEPCFDETHHELSEDEAQASCFCRAIAWLVMDRGSRLARGFDPVRFFLLTARIGEHLYLLDQRTPWRIVVRLLQVLDKNPGT